MSMSAGLTVAADDLLDLGHVVVADFKARAGGHAQVDDELAGIGAREVSAAEEREGHDEQQRPRRRGSLRR